MKDKKMFTFLKESLGNYFYLFKNLFVCVSISVRVLNAAKCIMHQFDVVF